MSDDPFSLEDMDTVPPRQNTKTVSVSDDIPFSTEAADPPYLAGLNAPQRDAVLPQTAQFWCWRELAPVKPAR